MLTFLKCSPLPKEGERYVLDSNIWLPILGFDDNLSEHYKDFFDKIIKSENCKILISPLQISEIFNRLIRFHAYKEFTKNKIYKEFKDFYKAYYRNTSDFIKKYQFIKDELEIYSIKFEIKELPEVDYHIITNFPSQKLDFNDNYIYQFAKQYDATLVSDDGDFKNLDIKIVTYNRKLYNAYKNRIIPKYR